MSVIYHVGERVKLAEQSAILSAVHRQVVNEIRQKVERSHEALAQHTREPVNVQKRKLNSRCTAIIEKPQPKFAFRRLRCNRCILLAIPFRCPSPSLIAVPTKRRSVKTMRTLNGNQPQIMSRVQRLMSGSTSISRVDPACWIALASWRHRASAFSLKSSKYSSRMRKWNAGVNRRRLACHFVPAAQ